MKTDMVMRLFNLAPPRGKNKDIDPQQTRVYHRGGLSPTVTTMLANTILIVYEDNDIDTGTE